MNHDREEILDWGKQLRIKITNFGLDNLAIDHLKQIPQPQSRKPYTDIVDAQFPRVAWWVEIKVPGFSSPPHAIRSFSNVARVERL